MFAYLSKKISITGGVKLHCVAWNTDQGWIACGGDGGLLKALRLDGATRKDAARAAAAAAAAAGSGAAGAFAQNQTLEGHSGAVLRATWNNAFNKLTTSDENGLIIVWTLHNGAWFEEMVNNRNKGAVRDMKWAPGGEKICIAYDDGAVICGSVDGNRLWGKDIGMPLSLLEWSPDGRFILFGSAAGEVHTYDASGNAVSRVTLYCNEGFLGASRLVAIEWYDGSLGHAEPGCPALALALDNGRMQLMRHDADDCAVCVDTGIVPRTVRWSHNGSVLAVAGYQPTADGQQLWLVQFYSQAGEHLRTMRVPGGGVSGIAWEASGLRLALAVDAAVLFTSVRRDRQWAYFADTLVYAFARQDRPEACVMFWGTRSNERFAKYVKRVTHVAAAGELCLLAAKGEAPGEHILILCNAIGSPVDSKVVELEPKFVLMTDSCAVAASEEVVYVWQFRNGARQLAADAGGGGVASQLQREGRERMFHIDRPAEPQAPDQFKASPPPQPGGPGAGAGADPICSIAAHQHLLLVARSSGLVHCFSLPGLAPQGQHVLRCRPQRMALNCSASRLAVVDFDGVLSFVDLAAGASSSSPTTAPAAGPGGGGAGGGARGEHLAYERKDVWDLCWASDNPELLAVMEKGRMYVLRGTEPEEPVASSACLAAFSDLQVRAVFLDDIMQQPDLPELDMVADYETRSLRDTRTLLASGNEADAQSFISDNPHRRLWLLLAEHALQKLDLAVAERAFVQCGDYPGMQLARHLAQLGDAAKQRAEVCAYFKRFDEAEEIYRGMDRLDLAIALRSRLGDWFKVERLVGEAGGGDAALANAWDRIGAYYSDRHKWAKAAKYYTQSRNTGMLVSCFYSLEDFAGLVKLTEVLPEGQPLLADIGAKLQSVGLCAEAVAAFLKAGDVKAAVDCCMLLHQWDQALALARQHDYPQAEGLLHQYAGHLLEQKKYLEAVELYRKAQRHTEAAKLLVDTAARLASQHASPLQLKKLHVLAALEVAAFKAQALDGAGGDGATAAATLLGGTAAGAGGGAGTRATRAAGGAPTQTAAAAQTLAGLMTLDAASGGELKGLDNAWRGAEAYHFWLLAHRQLYAGQVDAALRTALRLRWYDDVIGAARVHCFLALVGFHTRYFGTCSKAFVKLEALPGLPRERREEYADLALSIFTSHPPADPLNLAEGRARPQQQQQQGRGGGRGPHGGEHQALLDDLLDDRDQVCVASGKAVRDAPSLRCKTCRHHMIVAELGSWRACPLCHSPLPAQQRDGPGARQPGKQARVPAGEGARPLEEASSSGGCTN